MQCNIRVTSYEHIRNASGMGAELLVFGMVSVCFGHDHRVGCTFCSAFFWMSGKCAFSFMMRAYIGWLAGFRVELVWKIL